MAKEETLDDRIERYEGYLRIDVGDLDNEIIEYPQVYYEVSKMYAEVLSIRDKAKNDVKELYAELTFEARQDLEKPTDAKVEAWVLDNNEHRAAQQKYYAANFDLDRVSALKTAFEQRSYAMREIVDLHACGYMSNTSIKSTARKKHDDDVDVSRRALRRNKLKQD